MKPTSKTSNLKSLSFIILFIAITAIGYTIGSKIVDLRRQGVFDSWKILNSPKKWEKIVEATAHVIWLQTVDNSVYEGCVFFERNSDCIPWHQVEMIPTDLRRFGEAPLERNSNCKFDDFVYLKQVPGNPVECVRAQFRAHKNESIIYYALLENGTIYVWEHRNSTTVDSMTLGFSVFTSIIIYVIGLSLFEFRSRKAIEVGKLHSTG